MQEDTFDEVWARHFDCDPSTLRAEAGKFLAKGLAPTAYISKDALPDSESSWHHSQGYHSWGTLQARRSLTAILTLQTRSNFCPSTRPPCRGTAPHSSQFTLYLELVTCTLSWSRAPALRSAGKSLGGSTIIINGRQGDCGALRRGNAHGDGV